MAEDNVEHDPQPSTPSELPLHTAQDDVVTVVLTADNHLGYTAFGQQPRGREELQQRLRPALDISASEAQESSRQIERLSPREELVSLADEWIAATGDEQEKQALRATKEDLLVAFDQVKSLTPLVGARR